MTTTIVKDDLSMVLSECSKYELMHKIIFIWQLLNTYVHWFRKKACKSKHKLNHEDFYCLVTFFMF